MTLGLIYEKNLRKENDPSEAWLAINIVPCYLLEGWRNSTEEPS